MLDESFAKAVKTDWETEVARLALIHEAESKSPEEPREQPRVVPTAGSFKAIPPSTTPTRTHVLARRIEHAVLTPQATEEDLAAAARIAIAWGVRALVVKPSHVPAAARILAHTGVKLVAVIGFPHGGDTTEAKVAATRQAIREGAQEIDMVLNIGALRQRDVATVFYEIRAVVEAATGRPVKVITETAYLTDGQKRLASRLALHAGAAYVKTSTGFASSGATIADIKLLRRTVGRQVGIKASGGIHTYAEAMSLLEAGADLIGTSHTAAILEEATHTAA